jgi:hypothetical protein
VVQFHTGLDPGGHGIFDFVHRDPKTLVPFLSTTKTEPATWSIKIARWQFPLSGGRVELLRHGEPFWGVLEQHGIESTIVRMPANFPPSGQAARELSGMGTPDLLGTYGTFTFFTSGLIAPGMAGPVSGGVINQVDIEDGVVHGTLVGPDNPFLRQPEKVKAPFTAFLDAERRFIKLTIGAEELLLKVGEWSPWVPIQFELIPSQRLHAEARFYLKQLEPDFELYVSPLNLDPLWPALPISHPASYASGPGPRDRSLLHAGHAGRHQEPQDRRAERVRISRAGTDCRRRKHPAVPLRIESIRRRVPVPITSATSTRSRT